VQPAATRGQVSITTHADRCVILPCTAPMQQLLLLMHQRVLRLLLLEVW
jgi:hypothetical protein